LERGGSSAFGRVWANHDQKALLPPPSKGKTRGCYYSCLAPDDGHEDARNMLNCKKLQNNKLEKLLHLVGDLFELYDNART
jgi:hypothetical protein